MKKYLVLNADDFGMCKSANEAVFELFKSGDLLSATIMMPCPAAEEAVQFSIDNPQYAIGIHTTLTSEEIPLEAADRRQEPARPRGLYVARERRGGEAHKI